MGRIPPTPETSKHVKAIAQEDRGASLAPQLSGAEGRAQHMLPHRARNQRGWRRPSGISHPSPAQSLICGPIGPPQPLGDGANGAQHNSGSTGQCRAPVPASGGVTTARGSLVKDLIKAAQLIPSLLGMLPREELPPPPLRGSSRGTPQAASEPRSIAAEPLTGGAEGELVNI